MELTVQEFFAGIGGLHLSLHMAIQLFHQKQQQSVNLSLKQIDAYDISLVCQDVYIENFKTRNILSYDPSKTILNFYVKDIITTKIKPSHIWLMSPPCQPYSRAGKQQMESDPRAAPFLSLLDKLVESLKSHNEPKLIFLENVPDFAFGVARQRLIDICHSFDFSYEEMIISPEILKIPYQRNRYYFLAWRSSPPFRRYTYKNEVQIIARDTLRNESQVYSKKELNSEVELAIKKDLPNFKWDMPAAPNYTVGTFTASYGKRLGKTGPVVPIDFIPEERFVTLKPGQRIRRYHPGEILMIHGFPDSFVFPEAIKRTKQYELVGNSISIDVVSELILRLLVFYYCSRSLNPDVF